MQRQNINSSFSVYGQRQMELQDLSFQLRQLDRLDINSYHGSSRSYRSNKSLNVISIPILNELKSSDILSMRSRNRKSSAQIQLHNSIPGCNLTFLNKSLIGKSSLDHANQFNFHSQSHQQQDHEQHKQLSQKSCPVGSDQTHNFGTFQKTLKAFQLGQQIQYSSGKEKDKKKFLKTKNLLRNLSSYLHKYIKYNARCKSFIYKYFLKKFKDSDNFQAQQFYKSFIQWTNEYVLTNFQQYQKIWTQDSKFKSIYRQICYKYYRQELFCDVQSSRLLTKDIISQYTPQFIEGLLNPKNFTHFDNQ